VNGMLQRALTFTKPNSSAVFKVTDLLRGSSYFMEDAGSHYVLCSPAPGGYVEIVVEPEEDLIEVADQYLNDSLTKCTS
jgi:hypothetical protein